jgi:hypothetical protein
MKKLLVGIALLASMSSFADETYSGVNEKGDTCSLTIGLSSDGIINIKTGELVDIPTGYFKAWSHAWTPRSLELQLASNHDQASKKIESSQGDARELQNVFRVISDQVSVVMESEKPKSYSILTKIKYRGPTPGYAPFSLKKAVLGIFTNYTERKTDTISRKCTF